VKAELGDPDSISDIERALEIGIGNAEYEAYVREKLAQLKSQFSDAAAHMG